MSDAQGEWLVSAEIYVSASAGASLRKPPAAPRRKPDKRDSVRQNLLIEDRKLKGHWRSATCRLSEEGNRCLLNVYIDENIFYQTLYIHLLNHTDIRQADSSLFFRKDCLGIYCAGGQRWTSNSMHLTEPVYLWFSNPETCSTWLALLRSYAIPEIYGRLFFPTDGGAYRMWRQVELTVIQARNLGNTRPLDVQSATAENAETDPVDLDVWCEIHLNGTVCGRTTLKKGIGSPDWHENFTFTDLPPFDTLDIFVWKEKKLSKPPLMGCVRVTLINFRRGESIEGWFPVLHQGPTASDIQVGDIRLKIRVDEEIILPLEAYSNLLQTFNTRNFLEWMTDFESKFKLKTIATQLLSIAVARNDLIDQVQEIASREVDGTPSSHQTLFRGNTIFTKVMELCMNWYGKAFLEASIGSVLRRLCAEKVGIEVDPMRSGKGTKNIEHNVELLIYWCQEFWNQIYSVRMECPPEMRQLFQTVRQLVEKRYRVKETSPENRELPWQSVSAFCFLRFIVPAILHPHLFGLCPGMPSVAVQRSLTLIAKVIQSLANLNATVQKEDFMRGVKEFLKDSLPGMVEYIRVVSTPRSDSEPYPLNAEDPNDRHERLAVINGLRHRTQQMPVLNKESIPMPSIPDIPKQLAIITSAVIRNSSRDYHSRERPKDPSDWPLHAFCQRCFDVEQSALQRVSQLATKISSERKQAHSPSLSTSGSPPAPRRNRNKSNGRPSTAPSSPADTSTRKLFSEPTTPSSPSRAAANWDPQDNAPSTSRKRHIKSSSTDSIPLSSTSMNPMPNLDMPDSDDKKKKGLLRGIWRR